MDPGLGQHEAWRESHVCASDGLDESAKNTLPNGIPVVKSSDSPRNPFHLTRAPNGRGCSVRRDMFAGMDKRGPNPFGWNHYSPWLFYPMALIGSFMMLGILGILFTAPAALLGVIPAFFPIIVAVRQWRLRGEQVSLQKTQLDQATQTDSGQPLQVDSAPPGTTEPQVGPSPPPPSQRSTGQGPAPALNGPSAERLGLALAAFREQRLAGKISDKEYYDLRAEALESFSRATD